MNTKEETTVSLTRNLHSPPTLPSPVSSMNSPYLDEQSEPDLFSNLPSLNDSSTGLMTRPNRNSFRSKHSETEQRRRSKINERFQALMDIIPQSDQKRDKASFLLEVIEYIHFLQEKVHMYEGSQQMLYQGPTKLIPWRNNNGPVLDVSDHSQVISSNDIVAAPFGLLSDIKTSMDPYVDLAASSNKIPEHCPISSASSSVPTEPLHQFVQHDFWQPRPDCGSVDGDTNKLLNSDEKPLASFSTDCSQRVLTTLTEALKSSGVDMSETMISVQLVFRKSADRKYSLAAFASEDNCNIVADEEEDSPTETRSFCKDIDNSQKMIRR